jgi:hypothetical protein
MAARALMVLLLLAVSGRFGLLVWSGYRNGRVKSASLWGSYWERRTQPRFYWAFMSVHSFVVVAFIGGAAAIILGVVPISN